MISSESAILSLIINLCVADAGRLPDTPLLPVAIFWRVGTGTYLAIMGKRALSKRSLPIAETALGREAEATTTKTAVPQSSRLAELLVNEVLWGFMAAAVCQRLAAAAIADGGNHEDLKLLAGLGSDGTYPANAWRDLERKLKPNQLRAAYTFVRNITPSRNCRP